MTAPAAFLRQARLVAQRRWTAGFRRVMQGANSSPYGDILRRHAPPVRASYEMSISSWCCATARYNAASRRVRSAAVLSFARVRGE